MNVRRATAHKAIVDKVTARRVKPVVAAVVKDEIRKAEVKDLVKAEDREFRDRDAVRWGHQIPSDLWKTPCDSTRTATASSTKRS